MATTLVPILIHNLVPNFLPIHEYRRPILSGTVKLFISSIFVGENKFFFFLVKKDTCVRKMIEFCRHAHTIRKKRRQVIKLFYRCKDSLFDGI